MYVLKSYLASYNYSGHYKVLIKYLPLITEPLPDRQTDQSGKLIFFLLKT